MRWTFEALPVAIRAAGPDTCSPMKRVSTIPTAPADAYAVTLPFGEAMAEPPPGSEERCAAFRATPLAYSVTATFADDAVEGSLEP